MNNFDFWKGVWDSQGNSNTDISQWGGWDLVDATSKEAYDGISEKISLNENDMVLEIGCGIGCLSREFNSSRYVGVDYSESIISSHKKLLPNYNVMVADILDLPFDDEEFDVVFCFGVFQYFPDKEYTDKMIDEMIRVSKRVIFIGDFRLVKTDDRHFIYPEENLLNKGFIKSSCIYDVKDNTRCNFSLKLNKEG